MNQSQSSGDNADDDVSMPLEGNLPSINECIEIVDLTIECSESSLEGSIDNDVCLGVDQVIDDIGSKLTLEVNQVEQDIDRVDTVNHRDTSPMYDIPSESSSDEEMDLSDDQFEDVEGIEIGMDEHYNPMNRSMLDNGSLEDSIN